MPSAILAAHTDPSQFLPSLLNFPKEQINDETVELLLPYFNAPDFNFESAKKASGNVAGAAGKAGSEEDIVWANLAAL